MKTTIWIINQYNSLPEHGHFNRHYYFGKYLKQAGYNPVLFFGSSPHNTDLQLVPGKEKYVVDDSRGCTIVFVKAVSYGKSKIKRVRSMVEYCMTILRKRKDFDKPDLVYGSSAHPMNCVLALRLAKKYRVPCICEVRDLWPASIVEIGGMSPHHPVIRVLYHLEKWIYKKADQLIFTMEGGKDYIKDQGWDREIDLKKVHHINNGIDLQQFDYDKTHFRTDDPDLDNRDGLNLIYTGSIRKANDIMNFAELAKALKEAKMDGVRILIYGEGPDRPALEQEAETFRLDNLKVKGYVEKKYIPYILSSGRNLNCMNYLVTGLAKYGGSQNKLFDYFAAGKPVLSNIRFGYDLIDKYHAGITIENHNLQAVIKQISQFLDKTDGEYDALCRNARKAAEDFDFSRLTEQLIGVIRQALGETGSEESKDEG